MSTLDRIEDAIERACARHRRHLEYQLRRCESPIEQLLFLAMFAERDETEIAIPDFLGPEIRETLAEQGHDSILVYGDPICAITPIYLWDVFDWAPLVKTAGFLENTTPCAPGRTGNGSERWVFIQPTVSIDGHRYRLDFAVLGSGFKIAIKCDGHDYHERTKEQAARDRSRDRLLQAHDWIVLRFTGSEIHSDAIACAQEIAKTIQREEFRQQTRSRVASREQ